MEPSAVVCQASRAHASLPQHQCGEKCPRQGSRPVCEALRERATAILIPEPIADYAARAYVGEV